MTDTPDPYAHKGGEPSRAEIYSVHGDAEALRLLVASVQDYAIFMLDPRGHILTWNLGAERIKGYTAPEVIGRHFSLFYTQPTLCGLAEARKGFAGRR